ncbi:hypothetical protein [Spartinivicinus poritis]|uniref:Uncharacterized protein n=1 Tax=Spartinivicinus poritis TaxID=2994640 RepID=A0ABT5UAM4_9GAMM|nr:hypothetical protein [Spartinivicinus sp. A2-2]MDE1462179.1 hypothetical protein [Spartinivicinus sp. A2-2]
MCKDQNFLAINTILDQVIDSNTLPAVIQQQLGEQFYPELRRFFIKVEQCKLLSTDMKDCRETLETFASLFLPLQNGLTQLYINCPDPEEVRGNFDEGKAHKARKQLLMNVKQLYDFVEAFYVELVKQHPHLPIPYPPEQLTEWFNNEQWKPENENSQTETSSESQSLTLVTN